MTNEYVLLVSIYLFLYMDNQNIRYLRKCKVRSSAQMYVFIIMSRLLKLYCGYKYTMPCMINLI